MQGNVRPENDTCPLPILIVLKHHWMIGILRGVYTLQNSLNKLREEFTTAAILTHELQFCTKLSNCDD